MSNIGKGKGDGEKEARGRRKFSEGVRELKEEELP